MRFCRSVGAAALLFIAPPIFAQSGFGSDSGPLPAQAGEKSFLNLLALMSGKCATLKIAGHNFACKVVAYAHADKGRVNFAVAIDDPNDDSHVVSFSGVNGKRADDNSYELPIDRMLLNSSDRPRVDGLPVPAERTSTGVCRQTGNFAAKQVSNITCSAIDSEGRAYELLFISDGTPVSVRRVRKSAPSIQDPFN